MQEVSVSNRLVYININAVIGFPVAAIFCTVLGFKPFKIHDKKVVFSTKKIVEALSVIEVAI